MYKVDDEVYAARVLTGMNFINSELENEVAINALLTIVDSLKSINRLNVDEYKVKDSSLETAFYREVSKIASQLTTKMSFGYVVELAISAYNANLGISAYDLANLLSSKLMYSVSGVYQHELERLIEKNFNKSEVVTREKLLKFCDQILSKCV